MSDEVVSGSSSSITTHHKVDPAVIIADLFRARTPSVKQFIVRELSKYSNSAMDFYLPQLVSMYLAQPDTTAETLRPYLVERCKRSLDFSMALAWLLEAYGGPCKKDGRGAEQLRDLILSGKVVAKEVDEDLDEHDNALPGTCDLLRLYPQRMLIHALVSTGKRLSTLPDPSKESKTKALLESLSSFNEHLPARMWLPVHTPDIQHLIVRIPAEEACVLNSKDRVPYILYAEVVEVADIGTSPIPEKVVKETTSEDEEDKSSGDFVHLSSSGDETYHSNEDREVSIPFEPDPEDPSASVLREPWEDKVSRIRKTSPYGHLPNWRLLSVIVKCGDDLRQELMVHQLLVTLKSIWAEEKVSLWLRPYKISVLSNDSGLIEPIPNTLSLHQIRKQTGILLMAYFKKEFGELDSDGFRTAQKKFVESCAAYCVVSYMLQLKDRHNGNILLDYEGHIMLIDYGFILGLSPGNLGFEKAPFKLTQEFLEVMGGKGGDTFKHFKNLMVQGLVAARKHSDRLISLVEIMEEGSQLPCFSCGHSSVVQGMRKRFHVGLSEEQLGRQVNKMVRWSLRSRTTRAYDGFQYLSNGIRS